MTDRFKKIILHQEGLMQNFRAVEAANGFLFPQWPVDPASMAGQHEIRRLAWCIQEELCEAALEMDNAWDEKDFHTIYKEMIDALHFIAEMMLTLGYWPEDLEAAPAGYMDEMYTQSGSLFQTMINLGACINLLKSKPWKQSLKPFDEEAFKSRWSKFLHSFFKTCYTMGMNDDLIELTYFGKAEENQARIDTGV